MSKEMSKDILDLDGRVAFITGASSRGIGSGTAKVLAKHGAEVFITARREEDLQRQVAAIESEGGQAAYAVCDVKEEEQVKAAVESCIARFGRLDIMVLAAGISGEYCEDVDFDTDNWRNVLGTNLDGVYFSMMYGYDHLVASGNGVIIPVLSMAALKVAGTLDYTATKGALLRMVPWCAKNMGPQGIRVNGIAPGLIDTDMTNPPGWDTSEMLHKPAAEKAPLRRCATIEDCANLVLFLVSEAARNITGQVIAIDAGEAMIE
ncbi:MAG: SDR family oxidoreductase [Coriobacteriales bacterium]|jgi:NAD(P)-dependent dehydrogenase (short-subunit alcohol dehydrogenase family)|nr:SDR family oxidoreductase [Coriobacteriales bacterium]